MVYDFDRITDRRGTGSLKWDVSERELPMWVADMDFSGSLPYPGCCFKKGGAWHFRLLCDTGCPV